MTAPSRTARAAALVLLAGLVAGCGASRSAPPAPATATPAASAVPLALPWPARDTAAVVALQAEVDGGAQPWLLDPAEVALSYATAAYSWPDVEAVRQGDGLVDVRSAPGNRASIDLTQPGRTGRDGIWVVTAARVTSDSPLR